MIKNFRDTIILTSQNPEAFINIMWEEGTDTSGWINPVIEGSIGPNMLYVNGVDINSIDSDASLYGFLATRITPEASIASFHLFTRDTSDFGWNMNINVYEAYPLDTSTDVWDVSILNRPFITSDLNIYEDTYALVDGKASYLLLRTNPKFSGNVKIVADGSGNVFLDTFKISNILSNKKYRKQQISTDSILSGDIRRVFSTLPLREIFKLNEDDTLDISIPETYYYNQFDTTYNYGARLFKDELYEEDYSLLAPLWINTELPDHFAIFRLDGVFNPETYDSSSLDYLAKDYIKNGKIVKSWGLTNEYPLGTYLNNHLDEINDRSPVFLSLSDYDANKWTGIAVDKGIITNRSEVPYFFNQNIDNFTKTNAFISDGFERNNLLCQNLLNLEYIFSDSDVSLYSMHRYFGLYLTENQLYKLAYYSDTSDGSIGIISLDGKDSSVFFNSSIFDSDGSIISEYKNRIFVLNDGDTLNRIENKNQIDGTRAHIEKYLNKPKDNMFSSIISDVSINPFISIKLDETLNQGDHLRLINKTTFEMWEVFGVSSSCLTNGETWEYNSKYIDPSGGYPTIYRAVFSIDGSISDQTEAIEKAFESFKDYHDNINFRVGKRYNDSISLVLNDNANTNDEWEFQRLTDQIINNVNDPCSGFNKSEFSNITFFGTFTPNPSDYVQISYDSSYGPINFELFGDRNSITLKLLDPSIYYLYGFDASVRDNVTQYIMYQGIDYWYRLIKNFEIETQSRTVVDIYYVDNPFTLDGNDLLILTGTEIEKIKNYWNSYEIQPLYISLMGINPVKDIDYTVYDSSFGARSEYWYLKDNDASTFLLEAPVDVSTFIYHRNAFSIISGSGEVQIDTSIVSYSGCTESSPFKFNTFDASAIIRPLTSTTISYGVLDGSAVYTSYDPSANEENISDYYIYDSSANDPSLNMVSRLKYGLTVPTVAKWVGLGTDCRNNDFRLLTNNLFFDVDNDSSLSNYIPNILSDGSLYKDEISYPSYKYLSSGVRNWKDYIYYDLNDVISYNDNSETKFKTIKQLMFEKYDIDIFNRLMYSNYNVGTTKSRSSLMFYNDYDKSLEVLHLGLSMKIKVKDFASTVLDTKDYNKYRFSFISTASRNYNSNFPIELIINENTETILMIWYQGNDILSYGKRDSTSILGKSALINDGSIINKDETNRNFQGFEDVSIFYSFSKAPFFVNNSKLSASIINIYGKDILYDSSYCSPFAQLNFNNSFKTGSIFNAFGGNSVQSSNFIGTTLSFNTFDGSTNYTYEPKNTTLGFNVINQAYRYISNRNLYSNVTCNFELLNYFLQINNVQYYIIREDTLISNNNFDVPPISISLNEPRSFNGLYTYNGWQAPKFNDILNFNCKEDKRISDLVEKDFTLGNTDIQSYKNIPQMWYNKVVEEVSDYDASVGNAIWYISDYNVFRSQWDASYYVLYDSSNKTYSSIDGFNSSKELPSFFGSKLINLPETIILENWSSILARGSYYSNENFIFLRYNLTKAIKNLFKNKIEFIRNWNGLSVSDDIIDKYINDTIIPYYNISIGKITLELFYRISDSTSSGILEYTYKNDMKEFTKLNFENTLKSINNEYIYEIKMENIYNNRYSYFARFIMFEK